MKHRRIQRKRTAGWRMPEGAVYVGRPTKWGKPYRPGRYKFEHADGTPAPFNEQEARELALRDFEAALGSGTLGITIADVRRELRGKDLVCWCQEGDPCHADVLLEIANSQVPKP